MTDKSCNSGHWCFQQVCGSLHWRFLNQSDLLSATVPHSWCHMWLQFLCLLLCAQEHDGHSQSLCGEDALLQKPMLLLPWMISPPYHPQSPAHHHSYALKMDSFFFTMPLCANHNEYKTLFTYLHKYRRKNKLLKLAVHGSFQGQRPMTAIMLFITYKMNLNTPQSANLNPWFEATNSGNKTKNWAFKKNLRPQNKSEKSGGFCCIPVMELGLICEVHMHNLKGNALPLPYSKELFSSSSGPASRNCVRVDLRNAGSNLSKEKRWALYC